MHLGESLGFAVGVFGSCLLALLILLDYLLQFPYDNCIFLPDEVQGQLTLNIEEVLSELPWKIRVEHDEGLEGDPELVGWKLELIQHLLHTQVILILAVEIDDACVDQEALLENVALDEHWHLFAAHLQASLLLMQSLFYQAAANLEDWLTVALLGLVLKHSVLGSLKHELRVQLFQDFAKVIYLDGPSELLAALD